jgi:hypothetical protein
VEIAVTVTLVAHAEIGVRVRKETDLKGIVRRETDHAETGDHARKGTVHSVHKVRETDRHVHKGIVVHVHRETDRHVHKGIVVHAHRETDRHAHRGRESVIVVHVRHARTKQLRLLVSFQHHE